MVLKRVKELKTELGCRYQFKRLLSEREVRRLQKQNPPDFEMQPVVSLVAGCVKIEITLYRQGGRMRFGYDVFVKDSPDSAEWLCYDSPTEPVSFKEADMLSVLDRVVQKNNLSYTECCFEKLNGKRVKTDYKECDTSLTKM